MNIFRWLPILPLLLTGCEHLPQSLRALGLNTPSLASAAANEEQNTPIEEVETNGLKAWLVEDGSLPLVSLQLMFEGAGSSSDPRGKEGRAMFAAALLDEGAGDLTALQFAQALEDKAIQLSFRTNEDTLVVQLRCLSEHLPETFRLIEMALTAPTFASKDVERKRALALSTLNGAKSQPAYVLDTHFSEMAYVGHPYGAAPLGSEKSLKAMTRNDLQNYMSEALTKDRLIISVTGDVKPDTLKILMEKHLDALPETSMMPSTLDTEIKHQGLLSVVDMDVPQSQVLLATPSVDRKDKRFMAAYVLNHIIGGDTLNSILGTAIREKKGLAYSVHSYLSPMSHSNSFKVQFATKNEEVHEAYATLQTELTALGKNGVTQGQLDAAIEYLTGSFVLSLDNNTNYTHYLSTMQRFDLGKDYLAVRNDKIRSVTLEAVNALATDMFEPSKWLVVVVGNPAGMKSGPIDSQ